MQRDSKSLSTSLRIGDSALASFGIAPAQKTQVNSPNFGILKEIPCNAGFQLIPKTICLNQFHSKPKDNPFRHSIETSFSDLLQNGKKEAMRYFENNNCKVENISKGSRECSCHKYEKITFCKDTGRNAIKSKVSLEPKEMSLKNTFLKLDWEEEFMKKMQNHSHDLDWKFKICSEYFERVLEQENSLTLRTIKLGYDNYISKN